MPEPARCAPRALPCNLLAAVIICLITICTLQSSIAIADDWLYWNDLQQDHAITRANLDGSGRHIVVPFLGGANNPAYMAVDPSGGKLYWANQGGASNTNNQIRRANLDGTGTEILYTPAVEAVGLDVDYQAGKLYWAEACCAIRRANLDGTGVETIYTTSHAFQFLALDVVHGRMYWSDFSSRQIFRASMNGTGAVAIVNGVDPRGIAVDPAGGKIYWTEAGTYQVMRANLDGSGAQTLVTGLQFPLGIKLDLAHGTMYWADAYLRAILRANLDGSNLTTIFSSSLIFPIDVALVSAIESRHTIAASAGAGGSITPNGAILIDTGANQSFAITADPCYSVSDVLVDGVSVGAVASYTFSNVTADHTIAAFFALNGPFTITALAGTGGSIAPSGAVSVDCGMGQSFAIAADANYSIANVVVDGTPQDAIASYTFSNVTANHTITASFGLRIVFELEPEDLNLSSSGKWVTGFLLPPAPFSASQIDVSSIRLNNVVAVSTEYTPQIEDDGTKLKVKFLRSQVKSTLTPGDHVPVTVTGMITSQAFTGTDYIKVKAGKVLVAGPVLVAGAGTRVTWDLADAPVPTVTLISSFDDGATWRIEAQDVANTGGYTWIVPAIATTNGRLEVIQTYEIDETGVVPQFEFAASDSFAIAAPLGVNGGTTTFALRPPNPVIGPLTVKFSLTSGANARLAVYDVSGRQLLSRDVGLGGPGWHTMTVGDLPAGIYEVRLSQGGRMVSARVSVIR